MLSKKRTGAILAAAVSALGAGAITSMPADATHGAGLKQTASAAIEGGTLTVNPATVAEVCWGTDCVTQPIQAGAESVGVALDYTLVKSESHLPSLVTAGGLPKECNFIDALGQTRQRPGAVLDLGPGSFQSLNGVKLTTRTKDGTKTEEPVKAGAPTGTVDPAPLKVCLLQATS